MAAVQYRIPIPRPMPYVQFTDDNGPTCDGILYGAIGLSIYDEPLPSYFMKRYRSIYIDGKENGQFMLNHHVDFYKVLDYLYSYEVQVIENELDYLERLAFILGAAEIYRPHWHIPDTLFFDNDDDMLHGEYLEYNYFLNTGKQILKDY